MFKHLLIPGVALVIAVTGGTSQVHDDTYIACSHIVQKVDVTAATSTQIVNPSGSVWDVAMDVDNRSLWFAQATSLGGLYKVDLNTLAINTMIVDTLTLALPREMVVNQDGDLVVTTDTAIYKYANSTLTKIADAPTAAVGWYGGLEIDIDTGEYVVQAKANPYPLFAIKDDGTLRTLGSGGAATASITQDIRTGDWYQAADFKLYRLKKGGSSILWVRTSGATSVPFRAIACDRSSAANPRIVSLHNAYPNTVVGYTDLSTFTVTTIKLPFAISNNETDFYRGNNVCTAKTAPGKWDVNVSFPGESGTPYIVALSLTGVRPGIVVPGGRRINLTFDDLAIVTLQNLIPSVFNPGPLVLDGNGAAKGVIDVSKLGLVTGIRVWVIAVTVSASGIGTIADPVGLTLSRT